MNAPSSGLWLGARPLVLASKSAARRALLEASGIPFRIAPADVDEAAIAAPLLAAGANPKRIAGLLARAKAAAVAKNHPDDLVLAADQTLDLAGELFMKPANAAAAARQLRRLSGRLHRLHSAAFLRLGARRLWAGSASASLQMRDFSDEFLSLYLKAAGPAACESVGGYQLEALGIQLFRRISGDHATILGLPLLGILSALRQHGYLRN